MFNQFIQKRKEKFEQRRKQKVENDIKDRTVALTEITFDMINGEKAVFTKWIRENSMVNGVHSYCELILYDKEFTVNGITYNTKNIIKITPKIIKNGLIKSEVKDSLDDGGAFSKWTFKKVAREDELE